MSIMKKETFGPVCGVMKVKSDEEALSLINDSEFGLTASIWTKNMDAAVTMGERYFCILFINFIFVNLKSRIESGTIFMNRCDCLDPALCWAGMKNSGVGVSLSKFGFDAMTKPKSFHLRH